MVKTTLLSIGDEILIGQILNSNSQWIADKITPLGCSVVKISTIGDGAEQIISELDDLLKISDLVIMTGGLGPTHDDITKQVLCEYFQDELVINQTWLQKLETQFKHRGWTLSGRNSEQALMPSRSELLYNRIGTAPGMLFRHNGKYIISMPGVPQEMKCIMEDAALPLIADISKNSSGEMRLYRNIQTHGIPESTLADTLEIDEAFLGASTLAFLPSFRGVKLRIGAYGENFAKAELELKRISEHIISRSEKYIISYDETPYPQILGELLNQKSRTISVAESCTGGLLGAAITSIPGSSAYFMGGMLTYSNASKINNLGVDAEIINQFGAVSCECAKAMSRQVRKIFNTDYGISITGIAGPDGGTVDKPVGTVWIAIADKNTEEAVKMNFGDAREMTRERAVQTALVLMIKKIKK